MDNSLKERIYTESNNVLNRREAWKASIEADEKFKLLGGKVYPYDTIHANIDPIFSLIEASPEIGREFDSGGIRSVCDIGCANGDLAFTLARSGFSVTAIDYSYKHDQAPYVVSKISEWENISVSVADMSVDCNFDLKNISRSIVNENHNHVDSKFDLAICVGVLYHLKNPFAFLESLSGICRYAIVGTHLFTHTPGLRARLDDVSAAYLVEADELNSDPTNYWILTERAFHRMVERSGFEILASRQIPNNALNLAVPDRTDLGVRGFVAVKPR